jgi:hypothetical protein
VFSYGDAGRMFHRQDGTIFLFEEDAETREIHRHRATPDTWPEIILERFGDWIRTTQHRIDTALAVVCFFLVIGTILLAFGGAAYLFWSDPSVSWTFWALGLGMWLVSMTFFFSFMDWPLPRHSRSS